MAPKGVSKGVNFIKFGKVQSTRKRPPSKVGKLSTTYRAAYLQYHFSQGDYCNRLRFVCVKSFTKPIPISFKVKTFFKSRTEMV